MQNREGQMHWPQPGVRHVNNPDRTNRLAEIRRQSPECEPWLGLLEAVLSECDDRPGWKAAVPKPAAGRPVKAPLLHGARITMDGGAVRRLVRGLLRRAGRQNGDARPLAGVRARRIDAVALLEAALCQDDARIDTLAATAGADPHALRVVGQMAAVPLLQACARALQVEVSPAWWEGYCPVCGAWPALAELRGLERKRWLRCGRCSAGWELPLLRCPFCDEMHHDNLGYLAPEESQSTRRVEVCKTCAGYLKVEATVRALPPWAVLLDDLAMLPLDVAALERGYARPARPGYPLEARISERRRGLLRGGVRLVFGGRRA